MEYNNIIALVPAGEHFDATVINEGAWITEGHLVNIENHLTGTTTTAAAQLVTISSVTAARDSAIAERDAANATIQQRDETILNLQNEIATLKAAPGKSMTETVKESDDLGTGGTQAISEIDRKAAELRKLRDGK